MAAVKLKRCILSDLLIGFHTHAELANESDPGQIVYLEKDVVDLLLKLKENKEMLNDFEIDNEKLSS